MRVTPSVYQVWGSWAFPLENYGWFSITALSGLDLWPLTFLPLNGVIPRLLPIFSLLCPSILDLRSSTGHTHRQTDRQTVRQTDNGHQCIMRTGRNKKTLGERTKNDYSEFKDSDADATCCSAACESNEVSAAYVTGEQWCAHLHRTDHTRCTVFTACSAQPVNVLQLYIQEYRHDALVITASEYRYRTTGTV